MKCDLIVRNSKDSLFSRWTTRMEIPCKSYMCVHCACTLYTSKDINTGIKTPCPYQTIVRPGLGDVLILT